MSLATLDDDQVKFDTIGGYILYKLEMLLHLILMNVVSRCLPVHRSWVHAKRLLGYPSCRQRQVEETMKDVFPLLLLLPWMSFFRCRSHGPPMPPCNLWWFKSGGIGSAADAEDVTRTWCKAVDRLGWSGCLQRYLFVHVPFFSWKHQPLHFEDKNMNIILFVCWVLASCWSLVFKNPWPLDWYYPPAG